MFSFLKKAKGPIVSFDPFQKDLLRAIVDNLSLKYPVFKQQWSNGVFVGIGKNPGGSENSFTYFMDIDKWKKLCNPTIENLDIKNIRLNTLKNGTAIVDVWISEGLIMGYKSSCNISELLINTIDVNQIWEKHYLNNDFQRIKNVINSISAEEQKSFNMIANTFEIRFNDMIYYPIHEIGNGSYVAVNPSGEVFTLTHDPFQVTKINNSLTEYLTRDIDIPASDNN